MKRIKVLIFLVIFSVLATIGCKDNAPDKPDGVWVRYSTQTDGSLLGTLELKESSLFIFITAQKGHKDTNGRYSLTENHITFEDDSCYNPGTYTYSVVKKDLTFTLMSDTCEERVKILSGTWTRQN
jgi:hypothetical protein